MKIQIPTSRFGLPETLLFRQPTTTEQYFVPLMKILVPRMKPTEFQTPRNPIEQNRCHESQ